MRKYAFLISVFSLAFTASAQNWSLTGNAGTNPAVNFLGTTNNQPLRFRINNYNAGEISTYSVSLGYGANQSGTNSSCVAIGRFAMYYNGGSVHSTAVGSDALSFNAGYYNTAVGSNSMYNTYSGSYNTALGFYSLESNFTGYYNTAIGTEALFLGDGSSYHYNTAVGSRSLRAVRNSQYNTAIGYSAGDSYDLGWNNTILGANSDGSFAGQYNIIAIGQGVVAPGNSTARIGNSATSSIGGYAAWTNFSDGRFKKDVQDNVKGLDFITKLRPVTYHLDIAGASKQSNENGGEEWDPKMKEAIAAKEKVLFSGFVAQEVEQAAKATGYDFSGVDKPSTENGFYGLRYSDFVVPLVKGMQEQQEMIREQRQLINELQKRLTELERKSGIVNTSDILSIRPNPSNGRVIVEIMAGNQSPALIKVFDGKGALVKLQQANLSSGNNQVNVDINNLPPGAYHISAEWDNGQVKKTARIVKQ